MIPKLSHVQITSITKEKRGKPCPTKFEHFKRLTLKTNSLSFAAAAASETFRVS